MKQTFQQVLSIGQRCRSRHQADRIFGKYRGRRIVFDWQVTPVDAFFEYLSNDFRGMFERADLVARDGKVYNDRYGTNHMHEFPDGIQSAEIDRYYPEARKRHDRWCASTKLAFASELSTLFVLSSPVPSDTLETISAALGQYRSNGRYQVLNGPENDIDSNTDWKGDDTIWDRHLSSFELRPPLSTKVGYFANRLSRQARQALVPRRWRL